MLSMYKSKSSVPAYSAEVDKFAETVNEPPEKTTCDALVHGYVVPDTVNELPTKNTCVALSHG